MTVSIYVENKSNNSLDLSNGGACAFFAALKIPHDSRYTEGSIDPTLLLKLLENKCVTTDQKEALEGYGVDEKVFNAFVATLDKFAKQAKTLNRKVMWS